MTDEEAKAAIRKPIPGGSRRGAPLVEHARPMPPDFALTMSYRPRPSEIEEQPVREGYVEPAFASSLKNGLPMWTWR